MLKLAFGSALPRPPLENTFREAFKYQLLSTWAAVPLTLRFRLALQRGGLLRSSLNPPRCSREQHGGVIDPNYKKQLQIKETEGFSWASGTAWPICTLCAELWLKIAVSPARQRGLAASTSQEQGKHKPSSRKQAAKNPPQHPD